MSPKAPPTDHRSAPAEVGERLLQVYRLLIAAYGPQRWWPEDSPFEVIIGAILTQATAWGNVEKAIANLKAANVLSPAALRGLPEPELARLVRPSGYFNAKAGQIRAFVEHLVGYGDRLESLFEQPAEALRRELLHIHGVGEETADSVILYAAGKPSFVSTPIPDA